MTRLVARPPGATPNPPRRCFSDSPDTLALPSGSPAPAQEAPAGGLAMRPTLVCLAAIVAFGVLSLSEAACSSDQDAVQAANAPIGIETSQMFITIENKSGGPLQDLTVTIEPAGAPPFTYLLSRLEMSQKRDVPLGSFS